MNESKFRYVLCPGRHPKPEFSKIYNEIYGCWRNLWLNAYEELKVDKPLYSDNFTRQDFIGAILYEEKCIALLCFRWGNSLAPDFIKDSSLSLWQDEDIKVASKYGHRIIICTQLAVHPLARNDSLGVSMLDLMTGVSLEMLKRTQADALAAHMRIDRKVNEVCAQLGAEVIRPNIHFSGGISGDFMVFYREKILHHELPRHGKLIKDLWNSRLVIQRDYQSEDDYFIQPQILKKVA